MGRAVPVMGYTVLAHGTHSLGYGTHSPGKWDALSRLMGHAVPAHLEDVPCKYGRWRAQEEEYSL
eukprot:4373852-Pyramimonas_sp.AAC.1